MSTEEDKQVETLNGLVQRAYANSYAKGFHDGEAMLPETLVANQKLMLIVSEVAEAMEVLRDGWGIRQVDYRVDGKPEGYGPELADVVIRVFDEARRAGISNFGGIILEKMKFNESRPHMHGKGF